MTQPPIAPGALSHRLTNGRCEMVLTSAGTGRTICDGIALNRWSADPIEDNQGVFIYLRDCHSGEFWSVSSRPAPAPKAVYRAEASSDMVTLHCENADIEATLEMAPAPDKPLELRRLQLRNFGKSPKTLEVTSFLEVVLLDAGSDANHPAFMKLFVQTEFDAEAQALVAHRRSRASDESWPWMVHALAGADLREWETDRLRFIGRNRSAGNPVLLERSEPLTGTIGNVLDACFSLRAQVEIPAGGTVELGFLLGLAKERAEALGMVAKWRKLGAIKKHFSAKDKGTPWPIPARTTRFSLPKIAPLDAGLGGEGLHGFNGYGGFTEDGSEYVIRLPFDGRELKRTPLPWINVIANERCGMLISESGAAHTWCRNSQANRLTPWSNDPVGDPHGEALYIRDEAAKVFWSPLPGPLPASCAYEVRHGFGSSSYVSKWDGVESEVTFFVPRDAPVRIALWRLKNQGGAPRDLSLFSYQHLVLGALSPAQGAIITSCDQATRTLLASRPVSNDFADGTAFAFVAGGCGDADKWSFTCDRRAFLGPPGSSVGQPDALQTGKDLDGAQGPDLDACFAQKMRIQLESGQTMECAFFLGEALGEVEWHAIVERFHDVKAVSAALEEVRNWWSTLLSGVRVQTPVPAINWMANGWLAYQAIACRLWARTAYYQSSGAYGFRDQLQDAGNMIFLWPELTRKEILLHAGHQFTEGDVLHWWHPAPIDRGLRTRISDDLLWLPFVTAYYVPVSGDWDLLEERVPFLLAAPLKPGEDERYLKAEPAPEAATIYEHCCRALDRSLTTGAHGLPLMGTGDWNDGMNRVGREGRGESVWLGFFLASLLKDFLPFCERRGDTARVARYAAYGRELRMALETAGWDGAWYRRAYYDDGTPLGTHDAKECRIDSLSQSLAVISRVAPIYRAQSAMDAVEQYLISTADGIIRLLTPAFEHTTEDPGYIKGYVAGVRENGGQYTHAACWVVKAIAELGRNERAAALLERLSPFWHSSNPQAAEHYKVEPYVIAADIYGEPPHVGRGGWTWYTGSAGWAYRVTLESVLGFSVVTADTIVVRPCVPDDWADYHLTWRNPQDGTLLELKVENPQRHARTVVAVEMDGVSIPAVEGAAHFPVPRGGGVHRVRIILG